MKITILDDIYLNYDKNKLALLGDVVYYTRLEKEFLKDDQELINRIGNSEIIVTSSIPISRAIIEACPNLKYITTSSTGVDIIDLECAREHGVIVSNIPSYATMSVAQATVALLLNVTNHIHKYNEYVKQGLWDKCPDWCYVDDKIIELNNKNVLIIGYGAIGKSTAKMFESLGMNILTYDTGDSVDKLEEYLSLSDVVSLHCPLTTDSKYIINSKTISYMKDGVILLNTSRGGLVNTDDLYDALQSNKISFAAFDVIDQEPVGSEHKLLKLDNFILTPHVAWASVEARKRVVEAVVVNIESYINGKAINTIE